MCMSLLFDMAPGAVPPSVEGPFTIMTGSTKLARINGIHRDLNSSLLHFREGSLVVAILALLTCVSV